MSKRLIAVLAAVFAMAIITAGCGSSGDSSTGGDSSTASLTKPEFIKQADAICEEGNESIETEANEFADENGIDTEKPTTEEQEEVVTEVVAPAIQQQAEDIDALGAPSGDEEKVEAIVEAVEAGADEIEATPSTVVEGKGESPFEEANELANEYGLKVCGAE